MAAMIMTQKLAQFPEILKHPHIHFIEKPKNWIQLNHNNFSKSFQVISSSLATDSSVCSHSNPQEVGEKIYGKARNLVQEFNPKIPVEEAWTPPSSWYTDPDFYSLELDQVFYRGWHPVGYTEQITKPQQFFTGRLGNIEYVVCRDETGTLHAFHNVCRHHASLLASGTGNKSCFICPYHGWTYGLDGALLKATRITGIKNFKVNDMGLVPIRVAIWGPFVLLNFEGGLPKEDFDANVVGNEWLGTPAGLLSANGVDTSLDYICRREYTIECNWKVFCDNYLDGGYHVPYAHKGLASGLNLESYSIKKVSIQSCDGGAVNSDEEYDRLGSNALYAFVYPNFMINRYGPWMDTNLVVPLGPRKCQVIFDYFLDPSLNDNSEFIEKSLTDSEKVQMEDILLSEAVQRGLESPAYNIGRYSPNVEMAMHHFHCLLYENLSS
ncbi:choline monooxygenase, chloroplastic isoform X1 [Olea europaea subsp. europaea]|uniref:Choline monooxygenase, chloroplastic n=1 Tax=Olea europaea subsp. europaea TaxID=158383 RepID=A0A8S0S4I3_OLEEU|nr:choline monooxygenase, chloroplastic isoform X1 [Olea europaea subsp. europaea]